MVIDSRPSLALCVRKGLFLFFLRYLVHSLIQFSLIYLVLACNLNAQLLGLEANLVGLPPIIKAPGLN